MQLGCSELVSGDGYCSTHRRKKVATAATKVARDQASYDWRWQQQRAAWRARHPLCAECERVGRTTPGQDVDHVIPFRGNVELMRATWNLQTLCRACHGRKTGRDSHWSSLTHPMPANNPADLVVLTGPPLAGKTIRARDLGMPVLDLDEIYAELGASDPAMQTIEITRAALAIRNQRLARGGSWCLIVAAPRLADRMFWATLWGARVELVIAPFDELERRRARRPMASRAKGRMGIAHWFRTFSFDAAAEGLDAATEEAAWRALEERDRVLEHATA